MCSTVGYYVCRTHRVAVLVVSAEAGREAGAVSAAPAPPLVDQEDLGQHDGREHSEEDDDDEEAEVGAVPTQGLPGAPPHHICNNPYPHFRRYGTLGQSCVVVGRWRCSSHAQG